MNRSTLLFVAAACALAVQATARPAASGILLDSYAAIVNGKVVTLGEVLSALQPAQERLAAQYQGGELTRRLEEEFHAVRNALIESELILLEFESQGGNLPDRAVEDHVNSVIHEQFNNDRAAFLRALAAERLTFSEWRKRMKNQLIVQIMRQREVQSKILITPLDLKQAYERQRDRFSLPERLHLRTLVLPGGSTPDARQEALDEAGELRRRLLAGETAIDAAPGTLAEAEWFDAASLNQAIRKALTDIPAGGVSAPLELGGDIYLVQVLDRQDARIRSLAEVSPELERELRRAEFERLNRIWIDTLRAKYFVQVFSHRLFD